MKSYEEVTETLLERRDRYVIRRKENRKRLASIASTLGCFSLVAVLGFSLWQEGMFPTQVGIPTEPNPPITVGTSGEDALTGTYWVPGGAASDGEPGTEQTASSTPPEDASGFPTVAIFLDPTQNMDDPCYIIPSVTVDGKMYLRINPQGKTYTPGQCLGDLQDFEGTYRTFWPEYTGKLYLSVEDPNIFIIVFDHGNTLVLKLADT